MELSKDLHLLGVSFRTAPAAVREALSFNPTETVALLQQAAADSPDLEAVVLSTCNRSEFYLATPQGSRAVEDWLLRLRRLRPQAPILRSDCLRYQSNGSEAAQHLFRVACGLDSAILGDVQILGQVKDAMTVAAHSSTLGRVLNRAFGQAIRAGQRARHETTIGRGAASIGSALAGMLCERYPAQPERYPAQPPPGTLHLLIIGAGEIARDIGRHLAKRPLGTLTFINRTHNKAAELAQHCGGQALPWSSLTTTLAEADVVIAATSASQPIVSRSLLDQVAAQRPQRPLLMIDAGLPRNVEPGSTLEVIDIDAIRERQEEVLVHRRSAIPAVESIVQEEVLAWQRWCATGPLEGVIKQLYHEVTTHSRRAAHDLLESETLTPAQAEQIVLRSFKHLLHNHVRHLRELSPLAYA